MRFVTDEESRKEYKKFLEGHERCNFQQSLEWAEIKKDNWKPEVILAEDDDKSCDKCKKYNNKIFKDTDENIPHRLAIKLKSLQYKSGGYSYCNLF